MSIRRIAIRLNYKQFGKLVALANRAISSITGNGNYSSPSPALTVVQAAATAVTDAQAVWGQKGSRGSHADYVDLCTKAKTLHTLLRALADYVNTTATLAANGDNDALAAILATSGFDLNKVKQAAIVLENVAKFRIVNSRNLSVNQVKIAWARPLNTTSRGDVSNYEVRRSATGNFSDSVVVASCTKASFIDTNNSGSAVNWTYWVIACNSKGAGATSQALTANVRGIA